MPDYLVLFVADEASDEHAAALRAAARTVPGAGFFDEPGAAPQRTVGVFARAAQPHAGQALLDAAIAVSAQLQARLEVQWREQVLGFIEAGRPDADLAEALAL